MAPIRRRHFLRPEVLYKEDLRLPAREKKWQAAEKSDSRRLDYTYQMRHGRSIYLTLAILAMAFLLPLAAATEPGYVSVPLRSVEKKYHDRVLYYLYNTPVIKQEPYFEVSVQLRDRVIVGEYTPRYDGEPLPEIWKVGEPVRVRLEPHYVYVQKPGGGEVKFEISDRFTPKPSTSRP